MQPFFLRRKPPAVAFSSALRRAFAVLAAVLILPASGRACACGCGIYEVGTSSMLPTGSGATAFIDYDYQDQDHNWSGSSQAPAADNPDKDIRTSFLTFGYQDMFNRRWGLRLEVPYESRHFETTGGSTGTDLVSLNYRGFGDVRIEGIYTGLLPDASVGLTFGLKLPTGSFTHNDAFGDIDRDTELGSGSTDLLLGGYKRFDIGVDYGWSGFVQAILDIPVLTQAQYQPGAEISAAAGLYYYNGWSFRRVLLSPIGQVKVSVRGQDSGAAASSPVASGYERVLVASGVEFDAHPVKVYADIEVPVYQRFNGDQMASTVMFRIDLSYMF
jgi:hypothetical protein